MSKQYHFKRRFSEGQVCRYGRGCLFAHGDGELNAWQEEYKKKTTKQKEKNSEEEAPETFVEEIMKGPESEVSIYSYLSEIETNVS